MKRKGLNLKLVAMMSVTLFSLAVLFTGTFAWFAAMRNKQLGAEDFIIKNASGSFKTLTIHELDPDKTTEETYKFYATPTLTITMVDWDTGETDPYGDPVPFGQFSLTDEHHPLLFIFEFKTELVPSAADPVTITGITESSFVADGELDENDDPVIKLEHYDNPLSSIITFYSFSYPKNNANRLTGIETYNNTTKTFNYDVADLDDGGSFVRMNDSTMTYQGFDNEAEFFHSNADDHIRYVAVIFDYYDIALEYIYNYYLGTPALEYETITFKCDWITAIV